MKEDQLISLADDLEEEAVRALRSIANSVKETGKVRIRASATLLGYATELRERANPGTINGFHREAVEIEWRLLALVVRLEVLVPKMEQFFMRPNPLSSSPKSKPQPQPQTEYDDPGHIAPGQY